ncbi:hypothetical protein DM860_017413 [Cuscuta australis]|uniref:Uncharacterized protein n=1 Tax=Cuscuta australis TaxID=267555 RepID=A0A328D0L9_9ASTE|nr:hypothetical protein DM860_017413 [Cuscuta australis]
MDDRCWSPPRRPPLVASPPTAAGRLTADRHWSCCLEVVLPPSIAEREVANCLWRRSGLLNPGQSLDGSISHTPPPQTFLPRLASLPTAADRYSVVMTDAS